MQDTARLTLRPGEVIQLFSANPGDYFSYCYAVALVRTPCFPGRPHNECNHFTVVCAQKYATQGSKGKKLWGWVQLDYSTKVEIGEYLLDVGAIPGRWYYLVVSHE